MCSCVCGDDEIMGWVARAARARRDEGYHCAESVFLAVAAGFDDGYNESLRLNTGLGGGIARTGRTCGAITGGVLALGHLYGRTDPSDEDSYARVAAMARDVLDDFAREFDSTECEELLGYNIGEGSPAEGDSARRQKCAGYIERAAQLFARRVKEERGSS